MNDPRSLAEQAIKEVEVNDPVPVDDLTVLFKNRDGTFSVCDNGEEVVCETPERAVEIIVENLS